MGMVREQHGIAGAARSGLAIRAIGLALLGGAAAAGRALVAIVQADPLAARSPLAWLLAAATFCCLSLGAALLVLGAHIFDEVEVSERWQRHAGTSDEVR